ncbi:MAG: laccase domain-containing protein [Patescibacteria group bacterium]|nr:laccase domain-containing protein [Patescibacteria group bacterium]
MTRTSAADPNAADREKQTIVVERPFGDEAPVKVVLLGRPENWLPSQMTEEQLERIANLVATHGVEYVFAPDPSTFNAEICHRSDLAKIKCLPGTQAVIRGGHQADGLVIGRRDAVLIPSADCATTLLFQAGTGKLVVAHTGLKSLLDLPAIIGERKEKKVSVIVRMMREMIDGKNPLAAWIGLCIGPQHFTFPLDHPQFGEGNRRLLDHLHRHWPCYLPEPRESGQVDLRELIRQQLLLCGVPRLNILTDQNDTHSDTRLDNEPAWHSHRRGYDQDSPTSARNGVLVIHE